MTETSGERWHVAQYAKGERVGHNVFTEYESALGFIRRKGIWGGTNVLGHASHCECRGRMLS